MGSLVTPESVFEIYFEGEEPLPPDLAFLAKLQSRYWNWRKTGILNHTCDKVTLKVVATLEISKTLASH